MHPNLCPAYVFRRCVPSGKRYTDGTYRGTWRYTWDPQAGGTLMVHNVTRGGTLGTHRQAGSHEHVDAVVRGAGSRH